MAMIEEELFHRALEKPTLAEQLAFLDEACAGQSELRQRVERLLRSHRHEDSFLHAGLTTDQPVMDRPGIVIGPYKLLEQVGEGGMGTVWMAQQTEPVKRIVALKLIKAGMDSRQVIARFEAERQALALMDHPNIARVLDAGATENGRPYFVMDLVKGVPITRYCDEHHLTPRQRLELFVPVCQAVQHAHQKGIIHRDLKPSNVLVALYDGRPVSKVIDFGVAKAAGQSLTDKTLVTGFGNIVGTVEYMSPEQAEFNQLDIDTRSDIYSLGVLLYELLTGSPPFSKKDLEKAGMLEMLRVIREQEPSKPSTKLSTAEGLPTLAANRGTEPAKLTRLVRGELDWIVMKALEKDRNRRYETANGFALDVQRYLADEPVLAGPPSAAYRLRKFVRRNKAGLLTAISIAAVLTLGTVASTVEAIRAKKAEGLATERLISEREARNALDAARNEKQQQRSRINRELGEALADVAQLREKAKSDGPGQASHWMPVRDTVRRAEAVAGSELADPILVQRVQALSKELKQEEADRRMVARLEEIRLNRGSFQDERLITRVGETIGDYFAAFEDYGIPIRSGDTEEAARGIAGSSIRDWLLAALDDCASNSDTGSRERFMSIALRVETDPWRRQYFDARRRNDRSALLRLASQPEAFDQPPATIYMLATGIGYSTADTQQAAEALLREGQRRFPADLWMNHLLVNVLQNSRSTSAEEKARLNEECVAFARAALAARPESPALHNDLAYSLNASHRYDDAIAVCRRSILLKSDNAPAYDVLGWALLGKYDPNGAIVAFRQAIELYSKPSDAQHAYAGLGSALIMQGDKAGAKAAFEMGIKVNPNTWRAHFDLGRTLHDTGDFEGAVAAYRKYLDLNPSDSSEGGAVPGDADTYGRLGMALAHQPYDPKAVGPADYRRAIELYPQAGRPQRALGDGLRKSGDLTGAISAYRKAAELNPQDALAFRFLAEALSTQRDPEGAAAAYQKLVELEPKSMFAWDHLADALRDKKDFDGAIAAYQKSIELKTGGVKVDLANTYASLGGALRAKGQPVEAIAAFRKALELWPGHMTANLSLGQTLHQQSDFDGAVAAYRKHLDHVPAFESAFTYGRLGQALLHEPHDLKLASPAACRKALEIYPQNSDAHRALGEALVKAKDYEGALAAYRKAIEIAPDNVSGHQGLASVLRAQGDLDAAIAEYRKALDLQPNDLDSHFFLAGVLASKRDPDGALAEYRKLIELAGTSHYGGLGQLGMAGVLLSKKDPDGAIAAYRKAIELNSKSLTAHMGLVDTLQAKGDFDEAIAAGRQAIAAIGSDHRDAVFLKEKLARAYQSKGNVAEAIPLLEQVRDWWLTTLGPDHNLTLTSMNNLALAYGTEKQPDRAIPLLEETVRLRRANLPADDPGLETSVANLGAMYRDAQRWKEAIPLLEEVVAWRSRQSAPPAQLTWTTAALATSYEHDQQFAKAEPLLRDVLQSAQQQFGADDSRTAGPLAALGLNLLQQRKYTEAEPLLRDCLALREKAQPDTWLTFDTRSMLGGSLLGQKKYAEAEPLLLEGYEGMKQRKATMSALAKPRLTDALKRLVQLYDDWAKPDAAAKWRSELEAQQE